MYASDHTFSSYRKLLDTGVSKNELRFSYDLAAIYTPFSDRRKRLGKEIEAAFIDDFDCLNKIQ